MPLYIRNFAEAMITNREAKLCEKILSQCFIARLEKHYETSFTPGLSTSNQFKIDEDLAGLELNMNAFIQRMKDTQYTVEPGTS